MLDCQRAPRGGEGNKVKIRAVKFYFSAQFFDDSKDT